MKPKLRRVSRNEYVCLVLSKEVRYSKRELEDNEHLFDLTKPELLKKGQIDFFCNCTKGFETHCTLS